LLELEQDAAEKAAQAVAVRKTRETRVERMRVDVLGARHAGHKMKTGDARKFGEPPRSVNERCPDDVTRGQRASEMTKAAGLDARRPFSARIPRTTTDIVAGGRIPAD
jgi:hypothetical protein